MRVAGLDTDLFVDVVGEGRPIVLLHGKPVDHRMLRSAFEPVFERIGGWRRIYLDYPGFGQSPPSTMIASTDDVVNVVTSVIDELGDGERCAVLGQSYGGYVAQILAARAPERLSGLGLLCPVVVPDRSQRRRPTHRVLVAAGPDLFGDADVGLVDEFRSIAVVQSAAHWAHFVNDIAPAVAAADPGTLHRIEDRYETSFGLTPSPAPMWPVLVLAGREDSSVGYRDALALVDRFPHATYAALDGAGHHAHVERPDAVLALVADWLDRVASPVTSERAP